MATLDELTRFGFEAITHWVLKGEKIGPFSFEWQDHGGWLYAFVVDGDVKYIGLTDRVLRSRMSDYAHIKSSQTERLRGLIVQELEANRTVHVYGWKQKDTNTLKTEEARLRQTYSPSWNRI
jgi:hypothetical protein